MSSESVQKDSLKLRYMDTGRDEEEEEEVDSKHAVMLQSINHYSETDNASGDGSTTHSGCLMEAASDSGAELLTPMQIKLERPESSDEYTSASGVETNGTDPQTEETRPIYPVKMAPPEETTVEEFFSSNQNDLNSPTLPLLRSLLVTRPQTTHASPNLQTDSYGYEASRPAASDLTGNQRVTTGLTLPVRMPSTEQVAQSRGTDNPPTVSPNQAPSLVKTDSPVNIANDLKQEIDKSCLQLSRHGEESLFLSVNIDRKLCSFVGSEAGRQFLTKRPDVMEHFYQFCQAIYKTRSGDDDASDQQTSTCSMEESEFSSPAKPPPKKYTSILPKTPAPIMQAPQGLPVLLRNSQFLAASMTSSQAQPLLTANSQAQPVFVANSQTQPVLLANSQVQPILQRTPDTPATQVTNSKAPPVLMTKSQADFLAKSNSSRSQQCISALEQMLETDRPSPLARAKYKVPPIYTAKTHAPIKPIESDGSLCIGANPSKAQVTTKPKPVQANTRGKGKRNTLKVKIQASPNLKKRGEKNSLKGIGSEPESIDQSPSKRYGLRKGVTGNMNFSDCETGDTGELEDSGRDWELDVEGNDNQKEDEDDDDLDDSYSTSKRRKLDKAKTESNELSNDKTTKTMSKDISVSSVSKSSSNVVGICDEDKVDNTESADLEVQRQCQDLIQEKQFTTTTTNRQGHFQCRKCNIEFKWSSSYRQHMTKHAEIPSEVKEFKCRICDQVFSAEKDLHSHQQHSHKTLDCLTCKDCQLTFDTDTLYNDHLIECKAKQVDPEDSGVQIKQEVTSDEEVESSSTTDETYTCSICLKQLGSLKKLEKHMELHGKTEEFKCKKCNLTFQNKTRLNRHLKRHREYKTMFECQICHQKFLLPWTLYRHNVDAHGLKQVICKQCGKFFDTQEELTEHYKEHDEVTDEVRKFSCRECGKYFDLPRYLYVHYKEVHRLKKSICRYCGEVLDNKALLSEHMNSHNIKSPHSCKFCAKAHSNAEELAKHMETHVKNDNFFQCEVCGEVYRQKCDLEDHKIIHTQNFPLKCKECGKGFRRKGKLKIHMISHREARPYQCEECGMCFKMQSTMLCHMRRHKGILQHQCPNCEKKFKSVEGLRNHMLQYHMAPEDAKKVSFKVYTCDYCGKMMGQKHMYQRHMRMHTGERPWRCELCGKQFTMPAALNMHKKSHMARRPYHCDVCDYGFVDQSKFKKHLTTLRHKNALEKFKNKVTEEPSDPVSILHHKNTLEKLKNKVNEEQGDPVKIKPTTYPENLARVVEFENMNRVTMVSMGDGESGTGQQRNKQYGGNGNGSHSTDDDNVTFLVVPHPTSDVYDVYKGGSHITKINQPPTRSTEDGDEEILEEKCVIVTKNESDESERIIITRNPDHAPETLVRPPNVQDNSDAVMRDPSSFYFTIPQDGSPGVITQVLQGADLAQNSNSMVITANNHSDGALSDSTIEAVQSLLQ